MAVVQISKIQIRRGKKHQGTGMPQLASGELAWAVDTQELFIGNGAISEGAPSVGNTKILTNKDSLLSIAAQYQYKFDPDIGSSPVAGTVQRTLQSRLDDGYVNARNFGILPSDELPVDERDQTEKIQEAINSIATTTNVVLEFDPGEYEFSSTITLPNNASVTGFGKEATVFKFTGTGIAFDTIDNSKNQMLKNFAIKITNNDSTCIRIKATVVNQNYSNVLLAFDSVTNIVGLLAENRMGIRLLGNGGVSKNVFENIEYRNLTYAVYSDSNASFNTFKNSLFNFLYKGIVLGANSPGGANYNNIVDSIFDKITEQALIVENGTGNNSRGNKYKDVGSIQSGTNSRYSVIKFNTSGNSSLDDVFERQKYLESSDLAYISNLYFNDVEGSSLLAVNQTRKISLPSSTLPRLAFRLPLNAASAIKIEYILHSTTYNQIRKGTLEIVVDRVNNRIQLADDYEYIGASTSGQDAVVFTANLRTNASGSFSATNIEINYINNNTTDVNTFTYTYSILS